MPITYAAGMQGSYTFRSRVNHLRQADPKADEITLAPVGGEKRERPGADADSPLCPGVRWAVNLSVSIARG